MHATLHPLHNVIGSCSTSTVANHVQQPFSQPSGPPGMIPPGIQGFCCFGLEMGLGVGGMGMGMVTSMVTGMGGVTGVPMGLRAQQQAPRGEMQWGADCTRAPDALWQQHREPAIQKAGVRKRTLEDSDSAPSSESSGDKWAKGSSARSGGECRMARARLKQGSKWQKEAAVYRTEHVHAGLHVRKEPNQMVAFRNFLQEEHIKGVVIVKAATKSVDLFNPLGLDGWEVKDVDTWYVALGFIVLRV